VSTLLQEKIERILPRVSKPARYIGRELHAVQPNFSEHKLRMVLSYPDLYEIGMSNLAVRILYETVNRDLRFSCERVFAPWLDFERELRKECLPLYSLESFTPICEFDVLGFSIGYELLYTNILTILELGGLSLHSEDRGEDEPIVIAGGPAVFNPEPIADFIDVFIVGDGELAIIEFLQKLLMEKDKPRYQKLKSIDTFDFTYVPSLYRTHAHGGYRITEIDKTVKKRIEPDLDQLPFPEKPLLPLTRIVQDRIAVEVSRGCASGCRFCTAGFIYRPVRERSVERLLQIIEGSLNNSGYDEVALLSLSVSDYSGLYDLVRCINECFASENVSVSLPSMRVNSTNIDILKMVKEVRKSGLTFAIESAEELMRNRINKPVDMEQLGRIVEEVSGIGWRLIKLYFMIGLPMAEEEGEKIANLVFWLLGVSRSIQLNVNVSMFVPKPHTPFQYAKQMDVEEADAVLRDLKERFSGTRVRLKFQNPRMSLIEGILSRGDRNVSRLIHRVYVLGERFSSWDDVFRFDLWERAIGELEIKRELYTGALCFFPSGEESRGSSESGKGLSRNVLPWHFISSGVKESFLGREFRSALEGKTTGGCTNGRCRHCGVCGRQFKTLRKTSRPETAIRREFVQQSGKRGVGTQTARTKMLFQFRKLGVLRFISHLDLLTLFIRFGKMAGIPFSYSSGFNPRPRLVLPFPLPLGIESEYEVGEAFLEGEIESDEFTARYNGFLPQELMILAAEKSLRIKSIASASFYHDYIIPRSGEAQEYLMARLREKESINARPSEFFVVHDESIMVRLGFRASMKKLFEEQSEYFQRRRIVRTMLWESREGVLAPFFLEKRV